MMSSAPITALVFLLPLPAVWISSPTCALPWVPTNVSVSSSCSARNSGETSLITSYLAYVDRSIISEVPFDMDKLAKFLVEDKKSNPSHYCMMTISEGATIEGGDIVETGEADAYGHRKLGGVGEITASEIKRPDWLRYHVSAIRLFDALRRS